MKFFLTIFTIALVAQISFGASIQRAKRNANDSIQNLNELIKDELAAVKTKLEDAYTEIPDTAAYASYKQDVEDMIKLFDDNKDEICIIHFIKLFEKLSKFGVKVQKDESEEGRKIDEIFGKVFDQEFIEKYQDAFKNIKKPSNHEILETC